MLELSPQAGFAENAGYAENERRAVLKTVGGRAIRGSEVRTFRMGKISHHFYDDVLYLGFIFEDNRGGFDVDNAILVPSLPPGFSHNVLKHGLEEVEQLGLPLWVEPKQAIQEAADILLVGIRDFANPDRCTIVLQNNPREYARMMLLGREMEGHLKDQVYFVAFKAAAC